MESRIKLITAIFVGLIIDLNFWIIKRKKNKKFSLNDFPSRVQIMRNKGSI